MSPMLTSEHLYLLVDQYILVIYTYMSLWLQTTQTNVFKKKVHDVGKLVFLCSIKIQSKVCKTTSLGPKNSGRC
jgi:hypothetical protein